MQSPILAFQLDPSINQLTGSLLKPPKVMSPAEKPGPRSDPKSQLLATLILANNTMSRIFAFLKTTWWVGEKTAKLQNLNTANFNNSQIVKGCWLFWFANVWKALLILFAISLCSNHLKRIISATQVLTSARLMTICHNNTLSWDPLLRETKLWLFHPLFNTLYCSVVESVRLMKSIWLINLWPE